MSAPVHAGIHPSSVDRMTFVKILPCRNYVAGGNKVMTSSDFAQTATISPRRTLSMLNF